MKWLSWEEIPKKMQSNAVKEYYEILNKKKVQLRIKRYFDVVASLILIVLLSPLMFLIAFMIKVSSPGSIIFRQIRVTQYGRKFYILKFRTMVENAQQLGTQVTKKGDQRVTKVGRILRKYRLDELPQLFNIYAGDMTFVGTRPEVPKYVEEYTEEMLATLLLPAGVTSMASIKYKDEEYLLNAAEDVDVTYVKEVLPNKMEWNLKSIKNFTIKNELEVLFNTIIAVI